MAFPASMPSKTARTLREGFNYQDHLEAIKLLNALRESTSALGTAPPSGTGLPARGIIKW